jgi:MerR family transcriptional regulator/heat shock protein HspR
MNLAGVERVFELEEELERMRRRVRNMERHATRMEQQLREEIERVRRSQRRELVVYRPPAQALAPPGDGQGVRVAIRRPGR